MPQNDDKTEKLHFFDISSAALGSEQSWSPNTLRIRMLLNYKQIPYTESFHSYPTIAPLLQSLAIPPNPSAPLPYTLPAIAHAAIQPGFSPSCSPKGCAMNDSKSIALHLDYAFPDTPKTYPSQEAWQTAEAVTAVLRDSWDIIIRLILPFVPDNLDRPHGRDYFLKTRKEMFDGTDVREIGSEDREEGDWKPFVEGVVKPLGGILRGSFTAVPGMENKEVEKRGPFFLGDGTVPSFADFLVVPTMAWIKRVGCKGDFEKWVAEGEEWKRLWDASQGWVNGQGEPREWKI